MSAPTVAVHSVTIASSILGVIYGVVAVSAIAVCVLPRILSKAAAMSGRPPAGLSRVVGAGRPQPNGIRWSPSYGGGIVRTHPGAYVPRNELRGSVWRRYLSPPTTCQPGIARSIAFCLVHFCTVTIVYAHAPWTKKHHLFIFEITPSHTNRFLIIPGIFVNSSL